MTTNMAGSSEESTASAEATSASAAAAAPSEGFLASLWRRFTRGELGQIPVVIGLVLIAIYFQVAGNSLFLSPRNLTFLVQQVITVGTIGLGAVLVLLIGEIDLSLPAVAYFCAGVMGVLSARQGWSAPAAIVAGVLTGLVIGAINGFFIAVVRVPSFIVTLAAFIFYQGLLSRILDPQTTLPIYDNAINSIAVTYLDPILGIALPTLAVLVYGAGLLLGRRQRQRYGLAVPSLGQVALRFGAVAVIVGAVVTFFEAYLGVPLVAVILASLIIIFWLLTTRTRFGRHLYAVGGNAEAARRAGINVVALRVAVFALAGVIAAIGGMLEASRGVSAAAAVPGYLLLYAIAAAVIGGVSLFGGRGSVWAIVLGALIVGSLHNGFALTNQPAAVEEMAEGIVLLLAVLVDAIARRRSAAGVR
jgi:D-xylose transport system permease protein